LLGNAVGRFHKAIGVLAKGFQHDFHTGHGLVGRFTQSNQLLTERLARRTRTAGDLF